MDWRTITCPTIQIEIMTEKDELENDVCQRCKVKFEYKGTKRPQYIA